MELQAVLFNVAFLLGTFLLALGAVAALGVGLDVEVRWRTKLLPLIVICSATGIALGSLLSGRDLAVTVGEFSAFGQSQDLFSQGANGRSTWPNRVLTLLVLAAASAIVLGSLIRRRLAGPGVLLFSAFVLFFITNTALSSAFGTRPDFVPNHWYALVAFAAAFASRFDSPDRLILVAKGVLLALLAGSLLLIAVIPDLVLQRPYLQGWVPGLTVRLWGLGSHANSIAPLALLFLVLIRHAPYERIWLQRTGILVAVSTLILAQSKTVWIIALLIAGVFFLHGTVLGWRIAWPAGRANHRAVLALGSFVAAGVSLLVALAFVDPSRLVDSFWRSTAGTQVMSLTGRSQIWDLALAVFSQNPMFGYGPKLWDAEFRQSVGMNFAFHAHNQYLQSLAAAGSVGLFGAIVYITALAITCLKLALPTRGTSVALFLLIFTRCLTENPLSTESLFTSEYLMHFIIFVLFTRWAASYGAVGGLAGSLAPSLRSPICRT